MQEIRIKDADAFGDAWKTGLPLADEIFNTVAVHDVLAPTLDDELFGVPLPVMVIPIPAGTRIPAVHAQEPAGI